MNIRKIIFLFLGILSAFPLFALDFTVGFDDRKNRDFTYSTCEMKDWGSRKKLPGKPGTNDRLQTYYGKNLTLDADINVGSMGILNGSSVSARDRQNLKVVKGLEFNLGGKTEVNSLNLKKSKMLIGGGVKFGCYPGSRELGRGIILLEDSSLLIKRNLTSVFAVDGNAGFFNNQGKRGGITLQLVGKSMLEIEGGVSHDMQIRENPKSFQFKIILSESDGAVPTIRFSKQANLVVADVEVNVRGSLKKGTYTLIEQEMRREKLNDFRSLSINGKPAALGDSFNVGGLTATLKAGPTKSSSAKDKQTANDLILEVK